MFSYVQLGVAKCDAVIPAPVGYALIRCFVENRTLSVPERSVVVVGQPAASGVRTKARKRRARHRFDVEAVRPALLNCGRNETGVRRADGRVRRARDGWPDGQPGRSAETRDHGRRSEPITMIVARAVHGACRSSGRGGLPRDGGGRTRRRAIAISIAMVMVIVTSGSAGIDVQAGAAEGDGGVKLDGTADTTLLRGERPSTVRSTETDAMPKPQRGTLRRRHDRGRECTACPASRLTAKASPAMGSSLARPTSAAPAIGRASCSPVRMGMPAAGRSGARA